MKCIQLDMDGITYFVTVNELPSKTAYYPFKLRIELYAHTLRSSPIYFEDVDGISKEYARYFTKKDAKKFIIRALGVQPIKTG